MLQLVARYADAWNTAWHTDPAIVKKRYEELTQACKSVGRDPATIETTVGTTVRLRPFKEGETPGREIVGTPEEIAQRLQAFSNVGTSQLIVALDQYTPDDIRQLGHIAKLASQ
jgi:alkanesulfonate monooxygenase SsuD/methylene tetrahydromethanopterin reductase-like flavin-dependent oxidoreductase (luciferase family)